MKSTIPMIGIIGGIGSGKSFVADLMVQHGGYLIAADQLGHEALQQPTIRAQLVARWGNSILNPQAEVDRRKLGRIVFADAADLRALESIVFPYIEQRILAEVAQARSRSDVKFIILDAAIMLETGWHRHCNRILFVDTPRSLRLDRLAKQRGWDEKELARREAVQMPLEEKKQHADAVIVNDAQADKVARDVQDALERWNVI